MQALQAAAQNLCRAGSSGINQHCYRFLGQGKPSTHLLAFGRLTDEELLEGMPDEFRKIFAAIRERLNLDGPE